MYANKDKIDWNRLSENPNAIELLSKFEDKINWSMLSILNKNLDKINWAMLSENLNAIELLSKNLDKINWTSLSSNPNAIELLKGNQDKIDWNRLSKNEAIFVLDYKLMYKNMLMFRQELVQNVLHPRRIRRIFELTGCSPDDLDKYM